MTTLAIVKPPQLVAMMEERTQLVETLRAHKRQWSQITALYRKQGKKLPKELVEGAKETKAGLIAKITTLDGEIGWYGKQALDRQYDALAATHERFASYFLTVARTELKPAQLARIERAATKMLAMSLRKNAEKCVPPSPDLVTQLTQAQ
jgi:hypothetical protein